MLSVASVVCAARLDISLATTANPLPASPALAASMEAFNARRLVWEATLVIISVIEFISAAVCWKVERAPATSLPAVST